ncbi:uncharacterized protein LOC143452455 [Clavelina lepadiformis]|uniref:uncharacterized protein LOC143452455 n=1 Tax=Clavelina lepadiformis TaxID=159417 RepID=UPI004042FAC9
MFWDSFCAVVVLRGHPKVDYVYSGTRESVCGESKKFRNIPSLAVAEVATIYYSGGLSFQLRGEEYRCQEYHNGSCIYRSRTRSLACGNTLNYVLVVWGSVDSMEQCKRSVDYGLLYLRAYDV